MIDMVQQALNERDHENSALRATNARLLAEMADLDQENTRCACEIFRMREENAALRLRVKELTDFPVVQAGRILDLQKENEALRAEIQALRMVSPAPTLVKEVSIEPVPEQAPAPVVEEKEALLETVPSRPLCLTVHTASTDQIVREAARVGHITPSLTSMLQAARDSGNVLNYIHSVTQDLATISIEAQELTDELTHCMAVTRRRQEETRFQARVSAVTCEISDLLAECDSFAQDLDGCVIALVQIVDERDAALAQARARADSLAYASFVARRTVEIVAQQTLTTATAAELVEIMAYCQTWQGEIAAEVATHRVAEQLDIQAKEQAEKARQAAEEKAKAELQEKERLRDEAERKKRDEVAAEVARRRLANQIKTQAAKEAARIQQAAEEKAKAELQEQRRLQAKAERKKLDEQKLQSASRATEKRKVRPVLTAADAVVQEADQYQAALNLSRVITKDPTDVSLALLLGIDQDDEDTNYTINGQVAQATSSEAQKASNKKADKATQKPSKTASKAQELEDKTRQAQALALELSKKLGPPPSDVCRQFRKREFDAFVLKIQNIIRSTVVPSTRVFGQVSESDYIGNLTLVKLYMDERLGVTSNMQLQYQNESMYCLVFMLEDPPMSHSFTTKSVSLETIAAWMDRLDFQEACWAQYPETFTTDVLALEPETKTAIKKEFATVLRYASIHGPRLISTGLLDGFGFPVFNVTADGDDGKPTLMDCTCIQLILWWRSGKLNDLQDSR